MSFPDVPPNSHAPGNKPSISHVARQSSQPTDKNSRQTKSAAGKMTQPSGMPTQLRTVLAFEPIQSISIPFDWKEVRGADDPKQPLLMYQVQAYFTPPRHPEAKLSFGAANVLGTEELKVFHDLLTRQQSSDQPHALTWPEIRSLGRVIDRMADQTVFDLKHISTRKLLGVPVLFYEGRFKGNGVGTIGITMDIDGTGRPEDLYLEAPEDSHAPEAEVKENLYAHYRPVMLEVFKSIVWKPGYAMRTVPKQSEAESE